MQWPHLIGSSPHRILTASTVAVRTAFCHILMQLTVDSRCSDSDWEYRRKKTKMYMCVMIIGLVGPGHDFRKAPMQSVTCAPSWATASANPNESSFWLFATPTAPVIVVHYYYYFTSITDWIVRSSQLNFESFSFFTISRQRKSNESVQINGFGSTRCRCAKNYNFNQFKNENT